MQPIKMEIEYSPRFRKQFKKAPQNVRKAFDKRLSLFIRNPSHPLLRNHQLTGTLRDLCSINVTGDWRALYFERKNGEIVIFELLGTHSQLYK